jgi:nucleoside-diphosphate-sugar epimerase
MELEGRTVLVTGATGCIGGRLVEKLALERGATVRVLVRQFGRMPRIARFPVQWLRGDITEPAVVQQAVHGCDAIFHCAYDFGAGRKGQETTAIVGTRNVAQAALRNGVARFVHVSSVAVYGAPFEGELTELSPWRSTANRYAQCKRAAERIVLKFHREQGLPVVVLQPALVYGPFSTHWTVGPCYQLRSGLVPLVDGGDGLCNPVYVDDVVDALLLAATRPQAPGETFLIAGEEPVTWKRFYRAYEAALGVEATLEISGLDLRAAMKKHANDDGALTVMMDLARNPTVFTEIARLSVVKLSLRTLKACLSDEQWRSLKNRVLLCPTGNGNGAPVKALHVPDESLLALYQSKAPVRIEKARRRLGYAPRFSFEQGMERTRGFLRWAGLA